MRTSATLAITFALMLPFVTGSVWATIKGIFHKGGSVFLNALENWYHQNDGGLVNALTDLAGMIVPDVGAIAFGDPTARAAAAAEILHAAETSGLSWGKKLLTDLGANAQNWLANAPSPDLARYLGLARLSLAALAKFGQAKLDQPGTHSTLELVIVTALKALGSIFPQPPLQSPASTSASGSSQ